MDVRRLIVFTVAAGVLPGCRLSWFGGNETTTDVSPFTEVEETGCRPPQVDFRVDTELPEDFVQEVRDASGVQLLSEVECRAVCDWWLARSQDDYLAALDECAISEVWQDTGHVGAPSQTFLACSGTAYDWLCEGRRPLGFEPAEPGGTNPVGRVLAAMAHLEAGAVLAFEELGRRLAAEGAPDALVERCAQAAADERVHARMLGTLAERRGGIVPAVEVGEAPADLEALAIHNAIEGCVGETWAAVEARWHAADATDPAVRAAFRIIAQDEARHAQLSWDVHAFLLARLDGEAQARVVLALAGALRELTGRAEANAVVLPDALGLPDGEARARMVAAFQAAVAAA